MWTMTQGHEPHGGGNYSSQHVDSHTAITGVIVCFPLAVNATYHTMTVTRCIVEGGNVLGRNSLDIVSPIWSCVSVTSVNLDVRECVKLCSSSLARPSGAAIVSRKHLCGRPDWLRLV